MSITMINDQLSPSSAVLCRRNTVPLLVLPKKIPVINNEYNLYPAMIFEENGTKIFLGEQSDLYSNFIQQNNIEAIVTVMKSNSENIINNNSIVDYLCIPIDDSLDENISEYFDVFNKFIDDNIKNNKNIFVHCHRGISRSPSFIISYLIYKKNYDFNSAFTFVREKRKQIEPNLSFQLALEEYARNINNKHIN